uniref:Uncharacterized protein n=1 Tax=Timema cristinae TaxID=61476 RepID=A0A7R9D5E5_TIMCR|nr:unnamed protein product [Timema cristinae]
MPAVEDKRSVQSYEINWTISSCFLNVKISALCIQRSKDGSIYGSEAWVCQEKHKSERASLNLSTAVYDTCPSSVWRERSTTHLTDMSIVTHFGGQMFKDFLQVYNIMSEVCFSRCVSTLSNRDISADEIHWGVKYLLSAPLLSPLVGCEISVVCTAALPTCGAQCVSLCTDKYVNMNNKLMQVYMEVQPIIMNKRMEEMSKLQESQQAAKTNITTDVLPEDTASISLPGSGKTTFCESLIRRLREEKDSSGAHIYNIVHVNYDSLIPTAKTGIDNFVSWKENRTTIVNLVEKILLRCKLSKSQENHSEVGTNINDDHFAEQLKRYSKCLDKDSHQVWLIIDDNMYYRSMRHDYYQLARSHCIGFCQIYFECSLQDALKYNSIRKPDRAVSEEVIKRMSYKLEPPNLNSSWEEFSLVLKSHEPFSVGVETAQCYLLVLLHLLGQQMVQDVLESLSQSVVLNIGNLQFLLLSSVT